ncbi:LOW QUALITY PROTEIN: NPB isoform 1 [Pongo abelii]|uniref:NPB isoform 1 n=1 Tax=Pongo abelii TaxID=9601 RepID=A0A2J8XZ25_PONAB|nr:LOW QUALITY PROTEIN: NPB isoform 1 [Pongo abelii]
MARPATLAASALALCLLLAPPGLAWYKPAAGRSSYSVGRAAGLLSGFHRSPYARRSQPPRGAEPPGRASASPELQLHPRLLSLVSPAGRGLMGGGGRTWVGTRRPLSLCLPAQAVCVQDVAPNLQRCERLPDGRGTYQCKADVFLSLRAADCLAA